MHFEVLAQISASRRRVADEARDDYLYPRALFHPIALSLSVIKAVLAAA
jgi:hypothetical protein